MNKRQKKKKLKKQLYLQKLLEAIEYLIPHSEWELIMMDMMVLGYGAYEIAPGPIIKRVHPDTQGTNVVRVSYE